MGYDRIVVESGKCEKQHSTVGCDEIFPRAEALGN
jgi:hypothetical protein